MTSTDAKSGNSSGIDWSGLLKWSLKYCDGTTPTEESSKERLKFLEAALREAMAHYEDPVDLVKEAVVKLNAQGITKSDKLSALHVIERCVEEVSEISRQLHKLGALKPLVELSVDEDQEVAELSLQILAFALPNNPVVQEEAWKLGALNVWTQPRSKVVGKQITGGSERNPASSEDLDLLKKELFPAQTGALSGLVRHNADVEKDFVEGNGCVVLTAGLASLDTKVRRGPKAKRGNEAFCLLSFTDIVPERIVSFGCRFDWGVGLCGVCLWQVQEKTASLFRHLCRTGAMTRTGLARTPVVGALARVVWPQTPKTVVPSDTCFKDILGSIQKGETCASAALAVCQCCNSKDAEHAELHHQMMELQDALRKRLHYIQGLEGEAGYEREVEVDLLKEALQGVAQKEN